MTIVVEWWHPLAALAVIVALIWLIVPGERGGLR